MNILTGEAIADFMERYIDKEKQTSAYSFELTVKSITQIEGIGRVDFSGKEFQWGQRTVLSPKRFIPNDEHGWWRLSQGEYVIRFNEAVNLPANTMAYVLPHDRISQNGAHHAPLLLQGPTQYVEVLFHAGQIGIEIKENARISLLMAVKF